MTTLDESLAKGLASRFLAEHDGYARRTKSKLQVLQASVPLNGFSKRGRWQTFVEAISSAVGAAKLSEAGFGPEKRRAIFVHYLGVPLTNPTTEWDEDALPVECVATTTLGGIPTGFPHVRCYVGKHALARVMQRLGVPEQEAVKSTLYEAARDCAIEEFSALPCWSMIYTSILAHAAQIGLLEELRATPQDILALSFVVPSKHGLFFAQLSGNHRTLNVRTFVHDRQLSDSQIRLKELLLGAVTPEEAKLLECLSPFLSGRETGLAFRMIYTRMLAFFDLWVQTVLTTVQLPDQSGRLMQILRSVLTANSLPADALSVFEQVGVGAAIEAERKSGSFEAFAAAMVRAGFES